MFTLFWDMHSGGSAKVEINGKEKCKIYVELPEDEAMSYFEEKFGRDPYNVTCDCCGEDYSINEYDTLEEATSYHREVYGPHGMKTKISVEEYAKRDDVLIIRKADIG